MALTGHCFPAASSLLSSPPLSITLSLTASCRYAADVTFSAKLVGEGEKQEWRASVPPPVVAPGKARPAAWESSGGGTGGETASGTAVAAVGTDCGTRPPTIPEQ